MKIVIDIPDEQIEKSLAESKYIHENEGEKGSVNIVLLYTNKKLEFVDISRKTDFYSLTDKYTVLPKGHGRLIDADKLELDDGYSNYDGYYHKYSRSQICNAPTVLEADEKKQRNNVEFVCDIFDEMNRDDQIKVWQYVNEVMEGE